MPYYLKKQIIGNYIILNTATEQKNTKMINSFCLQRNSCNNTRRIIQYFIDSLEE